MQNHANKKSSVAADAFSLKGGCGSPVDISETHLAWFAGGFLESPPVICWQKGQKGLENAPRSHGQNENGRLLCQPGPRRRWHPGGRQFGHGRPGTNWCDFGSSRMMRIAKRSHKFGCCPIQRSPAAQLNLQGRRNRLGDVFWCLLNVFQSDLRSGTCF